MRKPIYEPFNRSGGKEEKEYWKKYEEWAKEEADETLYSGGGCEDCPFGNGEGGCEGPDCQFEGAERVPTAREWVNDPSYVGD